MQQSRNDPPASGRPWPQYDNNYVWLYLFQTGPSQEDLSRLQHLRYRLRIIFQPSICMSPVFPAKVKCRSARFANIGHLRFTSCYRLVSLLRQQSGCVLHLKGSNHGWCWCVLLSCGLEALVRMLSCPWAPLRDPARHVFALSGNKMRPTNPNAHPFGNGADVETHREENLIDVATRGCSQFCIFGSAWLCDEDATRKV